jgi:hypothetical protein
MAPAIKRMLSERPRLLRMVTAISISLAGLSLKAMTKDEVLQEVRRLSREGAITSTELSRAYEGGQGQVTVRREHVGLAEILYYIGGAIVFIGIVVLVAQQWDSLSNFSQILVTLGSGIAAYVTGLLLTRYPQTRGVGTAFYFISALLLPLGLAVTFDQANYNIGTARIQSIMAAILLATYLFSRLVLKAKIFTIFSIIFGTWFFYSFVTMFVQNATSFYDTLKFYEYLTLVTGLSYILLGYYFAQTAERGLTGVLYSFGLLGLLSSTLSLGGWTPNQNIFWEVIFPGLALVIVFLSIQLKSKAFLTLGSIFLMAYILKITAEYFSNSLGWPVALVFAGLVLIGIGYLTFYLNRRYLSRRVTAV